MSIHVDAAVLTIAKCIAEQRAATNDHVVYQGWDRAGIELQRQCLIAATAALGSVRPAYNTSHKIIARITPSTSYGEVA